MGRTIGDVLRCSSSAVTRVLPNAQPDRGGIAHRLRPLGQGREVPTRLDNPLAAPMGQPVEEAPPCFSANAARHPCCNGAELSPVSSPPHAAYRIWKPVIT
jgi:hypothetical protein